MSDRRSFLRGLVSLPLIGGGVTLIGKPAAALPLSQVAAVPDLFADPQQRARYAWTAFAAAMRDITAGSDAWHVSGGQTVQTVGYMRADDPWVSIRSINYVPMAGTRGGVYDACTAETYLR